MLAIDSAVQTVVVRNLILARLLTNGIVMILTTGGAWRAQR
ncbi:MAG: hypothetical protein U0074_10755 [Kouleothrix sp.]